MSERSAIILALFIGALGPAALANGGIGDLTKGMGMTAKSSIASGIETSARQAIRDRQAEGVKLAATPAFPADWPPLNQAVRLRVFFHRSEPAPGGMVAFDVWPPELAVKVSVDGDTVSVDEIETLEPSGPAELQYEVADPVSDSVIAAATQAMLSVLASADTTGADAAEVREAYGAWLTQNPVIRKALRSEQSAFFEWLEAKSP